METVKLTKAFKSFRCRVVLTMFDARTNLSIQVVDEVKYFKK